MKKCPRNRGNFSFMGRQHGPIGIAAGLAGVGARPQQRPGLVAQLAGALHRAHLFAGFGGIAAAGKGYFGVCAQRQDLFLAGDAVLPPPKLRPGGRLRPRGRHFQVKPARIGQPQPWAAFRTAGGAAFHVGQGHFWHSRKGARCDTPSRTPHIPPQLSGSQRTPAHRSGRRNEKSPGLRDFFGYFCGAWRYLPNHSLEETEGFEPSMELLTPYSLSRGAPSATRSRLPGQDDDSSSAWRAVRQTPQQTAPQLPRR